MRSFAANDRNPHHAPSLSLARVLLKHPAMAIERFHADNNVTGLVVVGMEMCTNRPMPADEQTRKWPVDAGARSELRLQTTAQTTHSMSRQERCRDMLRAKACKSRRRLLFSVIVDELSGCPYFFVHNPRPYLCIMLEQLVLRSYADVRRAT